MNCIVHDDFKTFTEKALTTESPPSPDKISPQLLFLALSMVYEFGCFMDLIKKAMFQGRVIDKEEFLNRMVWVVMHAEPLMLGASDLNNPNYDAGIEVKNVREVGGVEIKDMGALKAERINLRLAHAIIGDVSENAELAKAMLDSIVNAKPIDKTNVGEEYADKDWYKALAFDELDLSEAGTRNAVLAKLALRYKGGFSSAASLNRDTTAERSLLEDHMGKSE